MPNTRITTDLRATCERLSQPVAEVDEGRGDFEVRDAKGGRLLSVMILRYSHTRRARTEIVTADGKLVTFKQAKQIIIEKG